MAIDKDLEEILSKRAVPEMRSNLEHRIIQASLAQEVSKKAGSGGVVIRAFKDFIDSLVLPNPALSLSMVLLIGLVLGAYSGGVIQDYNSLEAYIMMGSDFDYGGDFL